MKIHTCLMIITFITTQASATEFNHESNQIQANKLLALEQQFLTFQAELVESKATISKLEAEIDKMRSNSVLALDGYLKLGSVSGHPAAVFQYVNVQVTSGSGRTDGTVNGLGNLIIGYNETSSNSMEFCSNPSYSVESLCIRSGYQWDNNVRRGSHNLIVGANNSYDDYGSIIAGVGNTSNANYANVLGGIANYTAAVYSNISGGRYNETYANFSSISGGYDNVTNGKYSSISGGRQNTTEGESSSISGGQRNTTNGTYASVTGGSGNQANEDGSSVTGGQSNRANGYMSTVSGGAIRTESGYNSWRAGNLHQDY